MGHGKVADPRWWLQIQASASADPLSWISSDLHLSSTDPPRSWRLVQLGLQRRKMKYIYIYNNNYYLKKKYYYKIFGQTGLILLFVF
jgi:hypothetical protein